MYKLLTADSKHVKHGNYQESYIYSIYIDILNIQIGIVCLV